MKKYSIELKNNIIHCADFDGWLLERTQTGTIPLYQFPEKTEYQNEPCIESNWGGGKCQDYPCTKLDNKTIKMMRVVAAWYFNNKKPLKRSQCVLHLCNNRKCVNKNHLILGSLKTNNRHKMLHGNKLYKSRHGLVESDVIEIRNMGADGITMAAIAKHVENKTGIVLDRHYVSEICLGKVLKHWGGPRTRRNKFGFRKSFLTDEQKKLVINLDKQGFTYQLIIEQLAREHGLKISMHRIHQLIHYEMDNLESKNAVIVKEKIK